jgi:hypothetical protein
MRRRAVLPPGIRRPPLDPLVTLGTGWGLAIFSSELEDNEPQVDLEHWSAEPPEPDGAWEGSARDQVSVPGGRLTLTARR